jgi:hypothetical protein
VVALRKLYTPQEADRALPLVRAITRDIRDVALRMRATWDRLQSMGAGRATERARLEDVFADERGRLLELNAELEELGVELKDPITGLVDFRAVRGDAEVYLCWRLGEEHVAHWHDLEAGFAGRRALETF